MSTPLAELYHIGKEAGPVTLEKVKDWIQKNVHIVTVEHNFSELELRTVAHEGSYKAHVILDNLHRVDKELLDRKLIDCTSSPEKITLTLKVIAGKDA